VAGDACKTSTKAPTNVSYTCKMGQFKFATSASVLGYTFGGQSLGTAVTIGMASQNVYGTIVNITALPSAAAARLESRAAINRQETPSVRRAAARMLALPTAWR
jgi:hypothetical protein